MEEEKRDNNLSDEQRLKDYFSSQEDDFYAEFKDNRSSDKKENLDKRVKEDKEVDKENKEVNEFFDQVEKEEEEDREEKSKEKNSKYNFFADRKKIITLFIVIFVVFASIIGCFVFRGTSSEDKIKNYLDVIFIKDSNNTYEKYLNSTSNEKVCDFDNDLLEIKNDFNDTVIGSSLKGNLSESYTDVMLENTLRNVDYKINSIDVIGSSAKVNVTLYIPDYEDIFILAINETINQNSSSNLTDGEYLVKLIENYNKLTATNINKTDDISFNLTFTKSEGTWYLSDIYNLTNKLFGRVNSGINNAYVDVMSRIEF